MKVYIVTEGYYSDKSIKAVFSDPEQAKAYANLDNQREIEEFELDAIHIEEPTKITVWYEYDSNYISDISDTNSDYTTDSIARYYMNTFAAVVTLKGKLLEDVGKYGTNSKLLLKIVQDRFAEYKAKHMIEEPEQDETVLMELPRDQVIQAMKIKAAIINSQFVKTGNTETIDIKGDEHT